MSRVYTDTIEPRKPTQDITLGTTGETITFPGNDLRVNTFKDKGGNTLWTSDGSGTLSNVHSGLKGSLVLLNTTTASGAANVTFGSSLITSTYDLYIVKWINVNPTTDNTQLWFNGSTDGGSTYNITKTTTVYQAYYNESGGATYAVQYLAGSDLADTDAGTTYQKVSGDIGGDADESTSGEMHLYTPSSTTFTKHFYVRAQEYGAGNQAGDWYVGGMFTNTAAINAIQFKMSTGNLDGIFKLYGLS